MGGDIVGTTRFVPFGHGLTPIEPLLPKLRLDRAMLRDAGEVGRLVIAPGYRAGAETLRRCLLLGLRHSMTQLPIANLYATCTPLLSRLYRRFGYSLVASDASHGPDGLYSVIHGEADEVLHALTGTERKSSAVCAHLEMVEA